MEIVLCDVSFVGFIVENINLFFFDFFGEDDFESVVVCEGMFCMIGCKM